MPNIRKSFNFRDGVQVDQDDFIVRGNLVGIGTTVPAEKLDVKGNVSVSGVVTTNNLYASGTATLTEVRMGAGITMSSASGIISATSFYGNGANLTNLPTSAWSNAGSGLGIYNLSRAGVGTNNPVYALQVGGNPILYPGVGVSTEGNVLVSGISTFRNDVVISTGSSVSFGSTAYFPEDVKAIFGNNVFSIYNDGTDSIIDTNSGELKLLGSQVSVRSDNGAEVQAVFNENSHVNLYYNNDKRFSTSGIGVTIYDHIETGSINLASDLSVTGVSTFADAITAEEITLQDGKKLNFGNSEDLAIYHDNSLGSQNDSNGDSICNSFASIIKEDGPGGLIFKSNGGDGPGAFQFFDDTWRPILKLHSGTNSRVILFHKAKERLATNSDGISISGSGTETLLDVTATGSVSRLRVGVGVGNSTAVFKFSNKNLDIFNNDTGNVTTYLHKGGVGVSTGSFDWVYGQTNAQLMTLTYGGSLGLGVDAPVNTLHVVGTSTVTSNAWVGGNLGVGGTITGTINYPDVITGTNLNNTSGLSTFFNIRASKIGINISSPRVELDVFSGKGIFQGVGIGTTNPIAVLDVKGIASFEKVGIGTTAMHQITGTNCGDFQVHNSKITCWDQAITVATSSMGSRIGVGTISPRCAVDFSDAGTGAIGAAAGFMMIPRVSSTVRDNFQVSAAPGSVIYNTTTNKMQCHNGSGWQDLF